MTKGGFQDPSIKVNCSGSRGGKDTYDTVLSLVYSLAGLDLYDIRRVIALSD